MTPYELKRDFHIGTLDESPANAEDVIDLWTQEAGLDEAEARRRLSEVAQVGVDPEGRLAGLTTAYLARSERLGMELWHMRGFVASEHRASNLASNLVFATRDALRDGYVAGEEPSAPGIVIEVENLAVERAFPQAVWPVSDFTFFGVAENGAHLRVLWFDGARAPTSPPGSY